MLNMGMHVYFNVKVDEITALNPNLFTNATQNFCSF